MIKWRTFCLVVLVAVLLSASVALPQESGGIRGVVYDKDFDVPLAAAEVTIAETQERATATDEGNYVFGQVEPGTYTLVFSKSGYARRVKADVVVSPGQMTELNASLSGEFTEMEEFVVQDIQIGTGTEAALLDLRIESPALMDSISSELMSIAGAGDAASALKLVAGATIQEGKYAVIRGLPDRYVNSQMNNVRLPTADLDKRAVHLDQFPSPVIESVQVSKTFTPDQQGDASGGAVNVVLKGIPSERIFHISAQTGYNTNVKDAGDNFLSYSGGGLNFWGKDDGLVTQESGTNWTGAVGTSTTDEPTDYKWSFAYGDKFEFDDFTLGAFGSFYYERDSSFYDDGVDDDFWVYRDDLLTGSLPYPMTPRFSGGDPEENDEDDWTKWTTSLFDVIKACQTVQWGGLGTIGLETESHSLKALYMYTRDAKDEVILAENTRGKESLHIYWPDFYPQVKFDEPIPSTYNGLASPPLRNQSLVYTERTTETLQFSGKHTLDFFPDFGITDFFTLQSPELDWTIANSTATLYQPDKRFISNAWNIFPEEIPWTILGWDEGIYTQNDFGGGQGTTGNLYRKWKNVEEESNQYSLNFKFPFEQWSGDEGYVKIGFFNDDVERTYDEESFANFSDPMGYYTPAGWLPRWTDIWPQQGHPLEESYFDVGYDGKQDISAFYWMTDIPLNSYLKFTGGYRFEKTELEITNRPDVKPNGEIVANYFNFEWMQDGTVYIGNPAYDPDRPELTDTSFKQDDVLPSLAFEFKPWDAVTLRGCYSETVARQTFKELSPIKQQEYVGGDIFAGNPDLKMNAIENYDLRLDFTPYEGSLFSVSYFKKDVTNPIEYVQLDNGINQFTTAVNYPKGELEGFEFEIRQQMGRFGSGLEGLSVGANATFIDSEVTLPTNELNSFKFYNAPAEPTRDMLNAPEHLYNLYLTYDLPGTGTQLGLFYTVRGDTLVAGSGVSAVGFIPSLYETEYGTLNFSLSQKLGDDWKLKFQAKNLTDPLIETVYRSDYIAGDVTRTSYRKGMEFSISLSGSF